MSFEEPETGGEAYIPLASTKARATARAIAERVAAEMRREAAPRTWYGKLGRKLVAIDYERHRRR